MSKITDKLDFSILSRLPVVLQSEAAECGLACLVMMAGYYGHISDLTSLRRRYQMSLRGSTLRSIIGLAGKLNMLGRPLRLELPEIDKLKLPCIVHWDLNHFVVLKKITRSGVVVHDPALGVRRFGIREFGKHFTGIALELTPTRSFEKKRRSRRLRLSDLWSRITGLKRVLVQVFVLSLVLQLFGIATPFYMQLVVDDVLISNDSELLLLLAIGFGFLVVVNVGVWLLRSLVLMYLSSQVSVQIASNLFQHLIRRTGFHFFNFLIHGTKLIIQSPHISHTCALTKQESRTSCKGNKFYCFHFSFLIDTAAFKKNFSHLFLAERITNEETNGDTTGFPPERT